MIRKLLRLLRRDRRDVRLLDHVPVGSDGPDPRQCEAAATRFSKLYEARVRHGRAFKCARVDFDREVIIVPGEARIVHGYAEATKGMVDRGNVHRLRRAG